MSQMSAPSTRYSLELSEALIDKALPRHARMTLNTFSLQDIFSMTVGSDSTAAQSQRFEPMNVRKVLDSEDEKWGKIADKAGKLPSQRHARPNTP